MSASSRNALFWLAGLFAVLLLLVALVEFRAQEKTAPNAPSSFNAQSEGVKALYTLLEEQGVSVQRLRASWKTLGARTGVLIVVEPFNADRSASSEELKSLTKWVENGGTLLYIVAEPTRPLDPKDPLLGDLKVVSGAKEAFTVPPYDSTSPYLRDVSNISYQTPVRLAMRENAPYQPLVGDDDGGLLWQKRVGKGVVLACAMSDMVRNQRIAKADNAILLVNIAQDAMGAARGIVAFDEYHHGVGFKNGESESGESVWSRTPLSLKLLLGYTLATGMLLLYNGNRRFGKPSEASVRQDRPRTDYTIAYAAMWGRAKAHDVAFLTLYRQFLELLGRHWNLNAFPTSADILASAREHRSTSEAALRPLLERGERISAGERLTESELVTLVKEIERLKREMRLV